MKLPNLVGRIAPTAALAVMAWGVGCAATPQSDDADMPSGTGGFGGGATIPTSAPEGSLSLWFDPPALTVTVLGRTQVEARVSPAREQTVAFALVGNSLDASLEAATVTSDATGSARVTLNAPSTPTTFAVRASVDRTTVAEAQILVQPATTGAVSISARYTGMRAVSTYVVRLHPNQDCSTAVSDPSTTNRTITTTKTLPVHIENVPLATPFSVVVEGDATTVRGCASARAITNATTTDVEVTLEDLPLVTRGASIEVAMTTTDGLSAFQENLRESVPTLLSSFVVGAHDLIELLDVMQSTATGSLQQEFSTLRSASNWDDFVVTDYSALGGVDMLRRKLRTWLSTGIDAFSSQPNFEVRLDLGPSDFASPQLLPLRIGGLDAVQSLSMKSSVLAYNIEAGDLLSWSSTLNVGKAVLLDSLAHRAASAEFPAESVPDQLALYVDCETLGAKLDRNAVLPNASSHVCAASCLATLCRSAVGSMYQRATAAAFGQPTTPMFINASGSVAVDASARPAAISGSWIGVFGSAPYPITLGGNYVSRSSN